MFMMAGRVVLLVQGLLCMHKDLSSIPKAHVRRLAHCGMFIVPGLGRQRMPASHTG